MEAACKFVRDAIFDRLKVAGYNEGLMADTWDFVREDHVDL